VSLLNHVGPESELSRISDLERARSERRSPACAWSTPGHAVGAPGAPLGTTVKLACKLEMNVN